MINAPIEIRNNAIRFFIEKVSLKKQKGKAEKPVQVYSSETNEWKYNKLSHAQNALVQFYFQRYTSNESHTFRLNLLFDETHAICLLSLMDKGNGKASQSMSV